MMTKERWQRLAYLVLLLTGITLASGLILYSLKQNINLFYTPSEALAHPLPTGHPLRLGGQVKPGSVRRDKDGLGLRFVLTDLKRELPVLYHGILPDLFREGTGAIADGSMNRQGEFVATQILAKHDEKYQPPVG
jgi:cytochrome c-type biogenesis protein CcmE